MACICKYIHSAVFIFPAGKLSTQLDFIRVAAELGMDSLYDLAIQALQYRLTKSTVSEVLEFSLKWGLDDLHGICETFENMVQFDGNDQQQQKHDSDGAVRRDHINAAVSNISLRNAITTSLYDVSELLAKKPSESNKQNLMNSQDNYDEIFDPKISKFSSLNNNSSLYVDLQSIEKVTNNNTPQLIKPKSGGIYGLLLKSETQEDILQPHLLVQQTKTQSINKSSLKQANEKSNSSNYNPSKNGDNLALKVNNDHRISTAKQKSTKQVMSSNLRQKSSDSFYSSEFEKEYHEYENGNVFDNESSIPIEFRGKMSLEPVKVPTPAQLRLILNFFFSEMI
jgi:hypothetical protein